MMGIAKIVLLLLVSTAAVVQSQPYPCPNYNVSRPVVLPGSKIDTVMRHGLLPTKIKYPTVIKDGESHPMIDLTPAIVPSPFVESFAWDEETCFDFFEDPRGFETLTSLFTSASSSQGIYDDGGSVFGSAYVSKEEGSSIVDYMALSQDNWNNSYYNNVRNELLDLDRCTDATLVQFQQRVAEGSVLKVKRPECQSFSMEFVRDVLSLPGVLEGNVDVYMDFCNKYGWYVPTDFALASSTTRVELVDDSGTTTYHFGQAGVANFTEENCLDPEVGSLVVQGWDSIGVFAVIGTNLTVLAENFKTFYETYPVDDRALPSIDTLVDEQLFTYEGVPEGCSSSSLMPTPAPTPSTTTSAASKKTSSMLLHVGGVLFSSFMFVGSIVPIVCWQ